MPRAPHLVSAEVTKPAKAAARRLAKAKGQKVCIAMSDAIITGAQVLGGKSK